MADNAPQLRSILRPTADYESESEYGLPSLVEGEYKPYASPANKPIYSIHFINSKGQVRTFEYVHKDSDSRFTAEGIELRFMGMEPVKITIHGRNLWRLHDYISQQRMPWVAESGRDFAADGQPHVAKVEIRAIDEIFKPDASLASRALLPETP